MIAFCTFACVGSRNASRCPQAAEGPCDVIHRTHRVVIRGKHARHVPIGMRTNQRPHAHTIHGMQAVNVRRNRADT